MCAQRSYEVVVVVVRMVLVVEWWLLLLWDETHTCTAPSVWPILLLLLVIVHNHVDRPIGASIVFGISTVFNVCSVHISSAMNDLFIFHFNCYSLETQKAQIFPFSFITFIEFFSISHSSICIIVSIRNSLCIQQTLNRLLFIHFSKKKNRENIQKIFLFFHLKWKHWNIM